MKLTARSAKWREGVRANVEAASGRSLDQWIALAKKAGMDKDPEPTRRWLKSEHGLTMVQAVFVLEAIFPSLAEAKSDETALLEAQFSGAKAALRPIYEALAAIATSFGDDVMIAPRRTQVTMARDVTFATVRAATKTRIDLALRLPGVKATTRLVANAKANGSDPTHVVALTAEGDVDASVEKWMKAAYDAAAR